MKPIRMIRIILIISFTLSLAFAYQRNGAVPVSPSQAVHQSAFQDSKPPLQRKKAQPKNEDDLDRPQGRTSISVAVDLVPLQVLVTDTKGNIITGLKPENFTIYEDNVKQEISHFSPIDANISVVLLVEYSKLIQDFIDQIWNAMYFFANSLRKEDWVAVIGYDMNPTIMCDFTQDRQKLHDALRRFTFPTWRESNISDAVIDTLDRTQELDSKVAIILLSTGLDTFSRHTYDEALQKCKKANASIYAIGLGQWYRLYAESRGWLSNSANLDLLMGDNRLKSFTDLTGGAAFFPRFDSELPTIFENISQSLRNQYSIAYASTNTQKDGKFRKIKVDVISELTDAKGKPLKLKVATRKGYIAKER
jgi:VWFA-related protein